MNRLLLVLTLLFATLATAQEAAGAARKKKVIRLDAITVEGRIQKPQAFFILPRSSLHFDEAEKKESFLPRIQKSCEKDPF